jgi:hypothetical protein
MASAVVVDSLLPLKTVLNCSGMGCSTCRNKFEPLAKIGVSCTLEVFIHFLIFTDKKLVILWL